MNNPTMTSDIPNITEDDTIVSLYTNLNSPSINNKRKTNESPMEPMRSQMARKKKKKNEIK